MNEQYIFHDGVLPSGYRCLFQEALFNSAAFRTLQSSDGWFSFYILDPINHVAHGQCHFHIKDDLAKSPLRAPFGSVEFSPVLLPTVLVQFMKFVELNLRKSGASRTVIKTAPDAYDPEMSRRLRTCLLDVGYVITETEAGSVIPVGMENFRALVHPRKRRKLQQRTATIAFQQLDRDSLDEVYQFIRQCRTLKGYTLSIGLDDLARTMEKCKDAYPLFGVRHEGRLVAASVTVRVNKNVLYHFISDHIRKIGVISPALILMEGIYNYCFEQKIEMLDLGTSMSGQTPKMSLVNFKREIGGQPTVKLTFVKNLV